MLGGHTEGEGDPEAASSDATITDSGMAAKLKALKFKSGRETSGSVAVDPKAIGSRWDNTDSEERLPARTCPWPDEVATREPSEDDPDAVLREHTRELGENAKASEEKDA
jgi:hypothetical protein